MLINNCADLNKSAAKFKTSYIGNVKVTFKLMIIYYKKNILTHSWPEMNFGGNAV